MGGRDGSYDAYVAREKTGAPLTLRAVGISADGEAIMLSRRANSKGTFQLKIDESLVAQLEAATKAVHAARARAEPEPEAPPAPVRREVSKLSPKEIQGLLREGHSVASVAKKAGVDAPWVERFEGPIVWERAGMAQRAQRSTLARSRRGPSGASLGESVSANLKKRRISMDARELFDAWDSVKRPRSHRWIIRFSMPSRGRVRVAEWDFDPESEMLTARDQLASELGWVEVKRRRKR